MRKFFHCLFFFFFSLLPYTAIAAQPNLVPYAPPDWDDKIVPSHTAGATTIGTLFECQPTYINFAIKNIGDAVAGGKTIWTVLQIDGDPDKVYGYSYVKDIVPGEVVTVSQMNGIPTPPPQFPAYSFPYNPFTPHTLEIVIDGNPPGNIIESNENDNSYDSGFYWLDCYPVPHIDSPAQGTIVETSPITVSGTCNDVGNDIDYVSVTNLTNGSSGIDSKPSGGSSPFSVSNISLNPGANDIEARCYDLRGDWTLDRITVTYNQGGLGDAFEPDDTWGQATTQAINTTSASHSIIPAGDVDWVKFTLTSTSDVTVQTSAPSGDTEMWLYDGGLNEIGYNDDSFGIGLNSKITVTSRPAGTYYIKVGALGGTDTIGSYTIQVTVTASPPPNQAPVTVIDLPANGSTVPSPVTVEGKCSDADGNLSSVTVNNDNTGWNKSLGAGGFSSPFSVSVPLNTGWTSITATCFDTLGVQGFSNISVNVPQPPPDLCPNDPNKTEPGICDCGTPDTDSDNDGIANCIDAAPTNNTATEPKTKFFGEGPSSSGTASDPVNTASGNYSYHRQDLATQGGRGLGLLFAHTYNAQDTSKGPMGVGWTHSYNIFAKEPGDGSAEIKWDDGHVETFTSDGAGGFKAPTGVFSTLVRSPGGGLDLTLKGLTLLRFAPTSGLLTDITDRKGSRVTLTYQGSLLKRVADDVQRYLDFWYRDARFPSQVTEVERSGRGVKFVYDADGNLSVFTDARGFNYQYRYTAGLLTEIIDPRNNTLVKNKYDAFGRVSDQWDGRNNHTGFSYDTPAKGETTVTDPLTHTTRHVYDASLRLSKSFDPAGRFISYGYDADGLRNSTTDRNNHTTTALYGDGRGNVTSLSTVVGGVTVTTLYEYYPGTDDLKKITFPNNIHERNFEYDAEGNLTHVSEIVDGKTIETWMTYDDWGRVKTIKDPENGVTTFNYNQYGDPGEPLDSIVDAENNTTHFQIDSWGRVGAVFTGNLVKPVVRYSYDKEDRLEWVRNQADQDIAFAYDENGNLAKTTDRRKNFTEFDWDENGFLKTLTVFDKLNNRNSWGWTYDAMNRVETTTDPEGRTLTRTYHPQGYLESVTDLMGRKVEFGYDDEGNMTSMLDAAKKTWTYKYDTLGRLEKVYDPFMDPMNPIPVLHYEYDPFLGKLKKMTDAELNVTSYDYYKNGWLKTVTDPLAPITQPTAFEYYLNGNLKKITNAAGKPTEFTYYGTGAIKTRKNALNQLDQYFYNPDGTLDRVIDAMTRTTQYRYDPVHALPSSIEYPGGPTIGFTYDENGNRKTMTDPLGVTTYGYDKQNRLETLQEARGFEIGYSYDRSGLLKTINYPGNKTVTYGYNLTGQLETVTDWLNKVLTYTYDTAGRPGGIAYPNGFATTYAYDDASRLMSFVNKKADETILSSYTFTFDKIGNRKTVTKNEPLVPWILAEDTFGTYNDENEIEKWDNLTLDFDDNGNLALVTSPLGKTTVAFNSQDLLGSITTPDNKATEFVYDGDGNRVSLKNDGQTTQFVVDPNQPLPSVIADADQNGAIQNYYIHGQGLAAQVSADGTKVHYYHYDPLGSTIALSDKAGNVTDQYLYDEFGNLNRRIGNTPNPFQYVGKFGVQNDPTGFQYMRARYYDPEAGRFISRDPIGFASGMNLYGYAGNDPVNGIDPSGLSWWSQMNNVAGVVLGEVSDIFKEVKFLKGASLALEGLNITITTAKDIPLQHDSFQKTFNDSSLGLLDKSGFIALEGLLSLGRITAKTGLEVVGGMGAFVHWVEPNLAPNLFSDLDRLIEKGNHLIDAGTVPNLQKGIQEILGTNKDLSGGVTPPRKK